MQSGMSSAMKILITCFDVYFGQNSKLDGILIFWEIVIEEKMNGKEES